MLAENLLLQARACNCTLQTGVLVPTDMSTVIVRHSNVRQFLHRKNRLCNAFALRYLTRTALHTCVA